MVIKTKFKFIKRITQLILFATVCRLQPVMAGLLDLPVITLSVADCKKAYMVQIFEDGRVEYRGGFGVKAQGWRDARINPKDVIALMKKLKATVNVTSDDREVLLGMRIREHGLTAIRLRQKDQDMTFFGGGKLGEALNDTVLSDRMRVFFAKQLNSNFSILQREIIRITNLGLWVNNPAQSVCLEGASIRIDSLKATK